MLLLLESWKVGKVNKNTQTELKTLKLRYLNENQQSYAIKDSKKANAFKCHWQPDHEKFFLLFKFAGQCPKQNGDYKEHHFAA